MSKAEEALAQLGLELPAPPAPVANYVGYTISERIVYISGQLPVKSGKLAFVGKLGDSISIDSGYEAGKLCALNILAQLKAACGGDLDRVARILRLGGFVNSTPEFVDAPKCINGASDLMVAVFGDAGRHARAAVSVAALPSGAAVEVDAVVELR